MSHTFDPNRPTGTTGLVAVDKVGNRVLFLDPTTYGVLDALEGFAPRVHELAIAPDRRSAYVPIYGDGRHGANPHPGTTIAVIDLLARRRVADISVAPFLAPHGLRWGAAGRLYCTCEASGVVLELDPHAREIRHAIAVGSYNAHRIEVMPDGSKLYTENEEDRSASVIDLRQRRHVKEVPTPNALSGLGLTPDGRTAVLVDAKDPTLLLLDTETDEIARLVRLEGHTQGAQIARYSPDGRWLVVTSHDEGLATILTADLVQQRQVRLGEGPMDIAFHPDGRTALIGNQEGGTLSVVDLEEARVVRTVAAGSGIETLAFY